MIPPEAYKIAIVLSTVPPTFFYPCRFNPPGQAQKVFTHMAEDFMKHAIDIVDDLLEANVNVTVYNGQLDLIVSTIGKNVSC